MDEQTQATDRPFLKSENNRRSKEKNGFLSRDYYEVRSQNLSSRSGLTSFTNYCLIKEVRNTLNTIFHIKVMKSVNYSKDQTNSSRPISKRNNKKLELGLKY